MPLSWNFPERKDQTKVEGAIPVVNDLCTNNKEIILQFISGMNKKLYC